MMVSTSDLYLNDKEYYFNIMFGFGSNMQCSHYRNIETCPGEDYQLFCPNFCWLWVNTGPWLTIDDTISDHSCHMAHESSTLWFTAPFILILCASCALLGTLFLFLSFGFSDDERLLLLQYLSW